MAAMLSSTIIPTATMASATTTMRRKTRSTNVVYIKGMGCFDGLKASNKIANLGGPVCTNYKFSQVVNFLRSNGRGGGALSSTCSAPDEIFKIAAIMNGLTLVGVAVGFVLLKIESIVEETE